MVFDGMAQHPVWAQLRCAFRGLSGGANDTNSIAAATAEIDQHAIVHARQHDAQVLMHFSTAVRPLLPHASPATLLFFATELACAAKLHPAPAARAASPNCPTFSTILARWYSSGTYVYGTPPMRRYWSGRPGPPTYVYGNVKYVMVQCGVTRHGAVLCGAVLCGAVN